MLGGKILCELDATATTMIEVLQPGLTTIQDLGRRGYEAFGMPRSGVFDPYSASIANKLVGNSANSALLEFALVGPSLLFRKSCVVAFAAFNAQFTLNDTAVPEFQAFAVPEGSKLNFAGMQGWFGYLAISGGIETKPILGSASSYQVAGIGGILKRNQFLKFETPTSNGFKAEKAALQLPQDSVIHILDASHTSLFGRESKELLVADEYIITAQSDRMGIRLQGSNVETPNIRRSIPTLPGVVQVAHSGQPIILGPEGPVTGGYPQIAILSDTAWTTLAARKPGKSIQFQWIDINTALHLRERRKNCFTNKDLWKSV